MTNQDGIKRITKHLRADVYGLKLAMEKGNMEAAYIHKLDAEANKMAMDAICEKAEREGGYIPSAAYQMVNSGDMSLEDTIGMMTSEDYKERFKAEFYQLEIRIAKLDGMLNKWLMGELEFEPTCSFDILSQQLRHMKDYSRFLRIRAEIEGVQL